ncbi:MAG: enoyl-CoA hydratase [Chloroflexi bacterium]|nr:enoyl-CoA hydratase [Chloroflexota bacterium]
MTEPADDLVLVERPVEGVAVAILNRPRVLNAINFALMAELLAALESLDQDPSVRAIVLRGSGERAFAAGADIREMSGATPVSLFRDNPFGRWDAIRRIRKPIIAAVRGFALGGGCELAMTCDIIVAGDDAQFGQPEIKLGIIPGAGGTQRLTRAIGKARAMELILTGRSISAREAEMMGLVSSVVPSAETFAAALDLAARVASMPPLAVMAAKEAVDRAHELALTAGLEFERREFYGLFASADQKEGMAAFIEKRRPDWTGE